MRPRGGKTVVTANPPRALTHIENPPTHAPRVPLPENPAGVSNPGILCFPTRCGGFLALGLKNFGAPFLFPVVVKIWVTRTFACVALKSLKSGLFANKPVSPVGGSSQGKFCPPPRSLKGPILAPREPQINGLNCGISL